MKKVLLLFFILVGCEDNTSGPVSPQEGRKILEDYRQERDAELIAKQVSQEPSQVRSQGRKEGSLRWHEFRRILSDEDLTELQKDALTIGQRVSWAGKLLDADTGFGKVVMTIGMPLGGKVRVTLQDDQVQHAVRCKKGDAVAVSGRVRRFGGLFTDSHVEDAVLWDLTNLGDLSPYDFWEGSTAIKMQMLGSRIRFRASVLSISKEKLAVNIDGDYDVDVPLTRRQRMNLNGLTSSHTVAIDAKVAQLHPDLIFEDIQILNVEPPLDPLLQGLPPGIERIVSLIPMREWTSKDGKTMRAELHNVTKGEDGRARGVFVRDDRKLFTLPLDRLSPADVQLIKEAVQKDRATEKQGN